MNTRNSVRRLLLTLSAAAIVVTSGCGHIVTYTDEAISGKATGILYYPPKPYLLVARTGSKDKPNDVQVVYLPDLSKPRYAVMKAGYGSSKLSLAFSNGVLTSAGQDTDPKITEAISALAGIPSTLATAGKTRAEAGQIRQEASDFPSVATSLRTIAEDVTSISESARASSALSLPQKKSLSAVPQQLNDAAGVLDRPETLDATPVLAVLDGVKKQLAEIKPGADPVSDVDKSFWARVRSAETALDVIIGALKPKPVDAPTLTLYEVLMDDSGTTLREVPLSTIRQ